MKVLVSFTGRNNVVVRDASFQKLTKRSDMFETIKLSEFKFPEKLILRNILLLLFY